MAQRVAAIQMTSSMDVTENLQMAGRLIQQAAAQGAQLVVLPEMFPLMTSTSSDKIAVAETVGAGPIQDFLAQQALKHGIWIVGGTIPLLANIAHKIRAACLVYDAEGRAVARYDKIHLFDVVVDQHERHQESAVVEPGQHIVVVDTPVGKLGLAVCYDIRFPELFREMFRQGAEIFAIPAAFTMPTGQAHWELLARARAVENLAYVIGSCQSGVHASGRKTFGHSLIVEPWGTVVAHLAQEMGVIVADIDLSYLNDRRHNLPVATHQRIFSDVSKLAPGQKSADS